MTSTERPGKGKPSAASFRDGVDQPAPAAEPEQQHLAESKLLRKQAVEEEPRVEDRLLQERVGADIARPSQPIVVVGSLSRAAQQKEAGRKLEAAERRKGASSTPLPLAARIRADADGDLLTLSFDPDAWVSLAAEGWDGAHSRFGYEHDYDYQCLSTVNLLSSRPCCCCRPAPPTPSLRRRGFPGDRCLIPESAVEVSMDARVPLAIASKDASETEFHLRGGLMVVDLRCRLSVENTGPRHVRAVTFGVVAGPVTAGGKASVSLPSLNVAPGDTFPVNLNLRLIRPMPVPAREFVQVSVDGVLLSDFTFFGPDQLDSSRKMTFWEKEADRDRRYFKAGARVGRPPTASSGDPRQS